jgi:hypothetical protein
LEVAAVVVMQVPLEIVTPVVVVEPEGSAQVRAWLLLLDSPIPLQLEQAVLVVYPAHALPVETVPPLAPSHLLAVAVVEPLPVAKILAVTEALAVAVLMQAAEPVTPRL